MAWVMVVVECNRALTTGVISEEKGSIHGIRYVHGLAWNYVVVGYCLCLDFVDLGGHSGSSKSSILMLSWIFGARVAVRGQ